MSNINASATNTYLIIGADGLIGKALVNALYEVTNDVYATSRQENHLGPRVIFFDLSKNPIKLFGDGWIQKKTAGGRMIVFICAAITKIATCEEDPIGSSLVNVANTIELGKLLMLAGAEVVFISSNTVFSGRKPFPTESSMPDPTTVYGYQKAEAEKALVGFHKSIPNAPPLMIVRLTKVVAKNNPLITSWIENLKCGMQIHAFENLWLSPISLRYTIKKLLDIASIGRTGTYHITGLNDLTYYKFACLLASALEVDPKLVNSIKATTSTLSLGRKNTCLGSEGAEISLDLKPEHPETVIKVLVHDSNY